MLKDVCETENSVGKKSVKDFYVTFTCEVCDKSFTNKKKLKKHSRNQYSEIFVDKKTKVPNPFKNITDAYSPKNKSVVGKKFVKDAYVTFTCEICDESFTGQKKLKKHRRNHYIEISVDKTSKVPKPSKHITNAHSLKTKNLSIVLQYNICYTVHYFALV